MKRENGITLIALVITIIVLLILAGVAIAMLSGENGILRKAAEAKTKTEEAQKQEEARLTDMELTTYFVTNNLQYKCNDGCVTGFTYDYENSEIKESIEDFENVLEPLGYKIGFKYDSENKKDIAITESEKTKKITTGMTITKDGKTVARTVVFGDVTCDEWIDFSDAGEIYVYISFTEDIDILKDFQKVACDVNHDGELSYKDAEMIYDFEAYQCKIEQNITAKAAKDLRRYYTELQNYIKLLDKSTGYTFEYNSETDTYKLKGVKPNTTVGELIDALPKDEEISITPEKSSTDIVKEGDYLSVTFYHMEEGEEKKNTPKFAYIELEK